MDENLKLEIAVRRLTNSIPAQIAQIKNNSLNSPQSDVIASSDQPKITPEQQLLELGALRDVKKRARQARQARADAADRGNFADFSQNREFWDNQGGKGSAPAVGTLSQGQGGKPQISPKGPKLDR